MITISTTNFTNTKQAEIDGHVYTVRNFGAGDQLDVSQVVTSMEKLQGELINLGAKEKTGKDITKEKAKLVGEFSELSSKLISIYAGLFDDGGDQSKSLALVKRVGIENVPAILKQIFSEENDG